MHLSERVYVIAGGGRGIGQVTAENLAELRANIVVNDLGTSLEGEGSDEEPAKETARKIRDAGGEAMAHFGDISDSDYTRSLIADTVDEFGRVDGIANFAGIHRDSMIHNMSDDEWDDVIEVNLRGNFTLLRSAVRHWKDVAEQEGGALDVQRSVLTVASESAMGNIGQINYSAAKAGVLGLTRTAARELFRYNIRVNALLPRAKTRMIDLMPEDMVPPDLPSPDDLGALNAYLLSPAAEEVTGCSFLNAGKTIGLISDPELYKTAIQPPGWEVDDLIEEFEDTLGKNEDLTKIELLDELE